MKKRLNIFCLLVLIIGIYSCDNNRVYDTWKEIPSSSWDKDSLCVFDTEITDTISPLNVILGVRNTNAYQHSNLWLFVDTETPVGLVQKDTFELVLASPYGEWYGSGWGNVFTSLHYYVKQKTFFESGHYKFTIKHGMRKNPLNGIDAVGVRIETAEQE